MVLVLSGCKDQAYCYWELRQVINFKSRLIVGSIVISITSGNEYYLPEPYGAPAGNYFYVEYVFFHFLEF
jgi:hypothetical protein